MPGNYVCYSCNFSTDRSTHYERHLATQQHQILTFLNGNEDSDSEHECAQREMELDNKEDNARSPSVSTGSAGIEAEGGFQHTCAISYVEEEENETNETSDEENVDPAKESVDDWFPFNSKAEMLLFVFMNSTTHPVVRQLYLYETGVQY